MKRKDNIYTLYQKQVRDKDTAVTEFIANTLAKTQSMFEYEGLPDSIPQKELERLLQTTATPLLPAWTGFCMRFRAAKAANPMFTDGQRFTPWQIQH